MYQIEEKNGMYVVVSLTPTMLRKSFEDYEIIYEKTILVTVLELKAAMEIIHYLNGGDAR